MLELHHILQHELGQQVLQLAVLFFEISDFCGVGFSFVSPGQALFSGF